MKIMVIGFTRKGSHMAVSLRQGFLKLGFESECFVMPAYVLEAGGGASPLEEPVGLWAARYFKPGNSLVFVGAVGIAVRSIAPLLIGKDRDPAIVAVDEQGRFAISLLSGHLGGANELACRVAAITGGTPVITTATDLNKRFAADLFAGKNQLQIQELQMVKKISAALLNGDEIGFFSDYPVEGRIPEGLKIGEHRKWNIRISIKKPGEDGNPEDGGELCLIPKNLVLGIGCRRGSSVEAIEQAVFSVLDSQSILPAAARCAASIDLKQSEKGLIGFAEKWGMEFCCFSSEELEQIKGDFTESEFVRQVTGISNVCERAALAGCKTPEAGRLLIKKTALGGVTVAAAVESRRFTF